MNADISADNNPQALNQTDTAELDAAVKKVSDYVDARLREVQDRIKKGIRSIFDFADMAMIVSMLVVLIDPNNGEHETQPYIDFVKDELVPKSETEALAVATAFYCLLRCGLVHNLSLHGNVTRNRMSDLKGYSIAVTHDTLADGNWYEKNVGSKEIVFHASELIGQIRVAAEHCFKRDDVRSKIGAGEISIIQSRSMQGGNHADQSVCCSK